MLIALFMVILQNSLFLCKCCGLFTCACQFCNVGVCVLFRAFVCENALHNCSCECASAVWQCAD